MSATGAPFREATRQKALSVLRAMTQEYVLLAVFGLYAAACIALIFYLRVVAAHALETQVVQKARAAAITLMAANPREPQLAGVWGRWLKPGQSVDEFDEHADDLVSAPKGNVLLQIHLHEPPPHVHLAIADGNDRVFILRQTIAAALMQTLIGFEHLYVWLSLSGAAFIAALAGGGVLLRERISRHGQSVKLVRHRPDSAERNRDRALFMGVVALSLGIFIIDLLIRHASSQEQPFQIALVNEQMPDCDGPTFITSIRSNTHFSDLRLIMMTSVDFRGDVDRLLQLGQDACLTKPVRNSELHRVMRHFAAHSASSFAGPSQSAAEEGVVLHQQSARSRARILAL